MHKILILGLNHNNIMDEVASAEANFQVMFSDSLEDSIKFLKENLKTIIIYDEFFRSHRQEISHHFSRMKNINTFIFIDSLTDRHLNQIEELEFKAFTMKTHIITKEFLENLSLFSEELDSAYQYKDLTIDYKKKHVRIGSRILSLTPMEYDLLVYLKLHSCMTLSRDELIQAVWGYSFLGDSRTIDTHIKSLRRKLGDFRCLVRTVWGKGYQFQEC
ncbi:winged helix-turn-helix domain-containing protein [Proteiniclasticum sp.]|uniref:winged helix-turn-helix domain-containing protein n=1 Tax=Proteiniclasticum sp. TaxID=2053595 RepID=UPI00289EAC09|nr:winged helix-turn-helix domain-containing protein [Proteiniclasticum sp.]